jgi:hypothetical protein
MEVRPLGTMRNPLADVSKPAFQSFLVQAIWLPNHRRRESHPGEPPSRVSRPQSSLARGFCRPIAQDGIRHHLPIRPTAQGLPCQGWSCPEIGYQFVGPSSAQRRVAWKNPRPVVLKRQCCQWRDPQPTPKGTKRLQRSPRVQVTILHLALNSKTPAIPECETAETVEAERDRLGFHFRHIILLVCALKFTASRQKLLEQSRRFYSRLQPLVLVVSPAIRKLRFAGEDDPWMRRPHKFAQSFFGGLMNSALAPAAFLPQP